MSIPPDKDNFSANLTGNWACQGQDGRRLPEEVLALGMEALRDVELLEKSMQILMEGETKPLQAGLANNKNPIHRLPLMQNVEAAALGAVP